MSDYDWNDQAERGAEHEGVEPDVFCIEGLPEGYVYIHHRRIISIMGKEEATPLCGPLRVTRRLSSLNGDAAALVIEFLDRDDTQRTYVAGVDDLIKRGSDVVDLTKEPVPSPIRIHPTMAETYRTKIGTLIQQLQAPDGMLEAKEALRGLIEQIILQPDPDTGRLSVHLQGALAALLSLSLGHKTQKGLSGKTQAVDVYEELVLVAGACNRRSLPQLKTAV